MSSIAETFIAHAMRMPDAVCIAPHDRPAWSRQDVLNRAQSMAGRLQAAGAKVGDRVTVIVEKSPEAFVLYLACNLAGYVYHPANSGYTDAELDYLIRDAQPTVLVSAPERAAALGEMGDYTTLTLDQDGHGSLLEATNADRPAYAPQPGDWAALLYTSGTTGNPKGAMLSQENLLSNAQTLVQAWRFTEADRLLHMLPIFHAHGLFVAGNTCLCAGASLLFEPVFSPDRFFARVPEATSFMAVPTLYGRLLKDPRLTPDAVGHMRLFTSGSAPLDAVASDAFEARAGSRILERYGMTETLMLTSNPYDGERRAGTVGPPLPGVSLRIRTENGALATPGDVGIVEVNGKNVCSGYFNLPDKTREAFTEDGFLITGDIGVMSEDGYLTLQGRMSDMIISGGYNVYPREVENVLLDLNGVEEAVVFGLPHPDFGEGVVAAATGSNPMDEQALIRAARRVLASYKTPKRILQRSALPKNAMGKVDRKALRAEYADLFQSQPQ
ncbi:MAG: AMP-binding protein [Pseudomonadota bacterium]